MEFSAYRYDGHSLDPVLLVKLSTEVPAGIGLVLWSRTLSCSFRLWISRGLIILKVPMRDIRDFQGMCEHDPTLQFPAMNASPWVHHCV